MSEYKGRTHFHGRLLSFPILTTGILIRNLIILHGLQLLLSSSMDKTVRLWDMDTRSCLKLFAHNDYGKLLQHMNTLHNSVIISYFSLFYFALNVGLLGSNLHTVQSNR